MPHTKDSASNRLYEVLIVSSLFTCGFTFYLSIFLKDQLVPMIDGPYYLIQVKSILLDGKLAYGDPPLTFYLFSIFAILLGDIIFGVKVGASFFSALTTIPAYFLMKRAGKGVFAGSIAMLLIILSAPYIRMLTDFMKNAIGVCWLLAFIYYLYDIASSGIRRENIILASFFLILTGLTHILDFGVALLFLILYTLAGFILNVNRRALLKATAILFFASMLFVLFTSTFFGYLFSDYNKAISFFRDLIGLRKVAVRRVRLIPIQPLPPLRRAELPLAINVWPLILIVAGSILSFSLWRRRRMADLCLISTMTIICLLMNLPVIPAEWLWRFELMTVVPSAIILSYSASRIWKIGREEAAIFATIIIVLSASQAISTAMTIHPTISYQGYMDLLEMKNKIPVGSLIVVSKPSLRYWAEYVMYGSDVTFGQLWKMPPQTLRSYQHIFLIFQRGRAPHVPSKIVFVGRVYVLVELKL